MTIKKLPLIPKKHNANYKLTHVRKNDFSMFYAMTECLSKRDIGQISINSIISF